MAFISEFTNEIYDQGNAAFQDQGDSTKVFLGVLVTLLPKVIRPPTSLLAVKNGHHTTLKPSKEGCTIQA